MNAAVRVLGSVTFPFTVDFQTAVFTQFANVIKGQFAIEYITYREGLPELGNPDVQFDSAPFVDIAAKLWQPGKPESSTLSSHFSAFAYWGAGLINAGYQVQVHMLNLQFTQSSIDRLVQMQPLMVADVLIGLHLMQPTAHGDGGTNSSTSVKVNDNQISAFEVSLLNFMRGWAGSYVEVVEVNNTALSVMHPDAAARMTSSEHLILVELTFFACQADNQAGSPPANCVETVTNEVLSLYFSKKPLLNHSIANGTIYSVQNRPLATQTGNASQPPAGPSPNVSPSVESWIPWHLDILDQREGPLDGKYTANAPGTGVNVYIVSSGVRYDHKEFQYADGRPGSRVRGLWGYNGLNPTQDCPDGMELYYFGTFGASLVGGLTLGVAKNVTIYSARTRNLCLFDSPGIWSAGGLPSALDAVISNFERPGVVVIDTWWSPTRLSSNETDLIAPGILSRLAHAATVDIPIIVASGAGLSHEDPCTNIFTQGETSIRVASVDVDRHSSIGGPRNSSCIDVWAPGGGLGKAMTGASALTKTAYDSSLPLAFGAAYIVAGIAAQYLQFNPRASTAQLKGALQSWATPGAVIGAGPLSDNLMAYTNLTYNTSLGASIMSYGQSSLSAGAIVGIVIGLLVIFLASILIFTLIIRMKRHQSNVVSKNSLASKSTGKLLGSGSSTGSGTMSSGPPTPGNGLNGRHDWEIDSKQIEFLLKSDGSPWVLGAGRWGEVHRALKDGIQAVAVKTLRHGATATFSNEAFAREIAMLQWLSRDANIVQFYGACVQPNGGGMMLVTELMEGGDLRAALTADVEGNLRWWKNGKSIALDVVRGLHFLHSHAVVHRDVKSKNILLTRYLRAKVGDVGLAYIAESSGAESTGEEAQVKRDKNDGSVVGTFAWAAPEMILGQPFSFTADIYSFGVVLWEILTHEAPVRGRLREPLVPEECPEGVADVLMSCLERDPELRPSARQVHDALMACPPFEGFEQRDLPSTQLAKPGDAPPAASPLTPLFMYNSKDQSGVSDMIGMERAMSKLPSEDMTNGALSVDTDGEPRPSPMPSAEAMESTIGEQTSAFSSSTLVKALGALNPRMRSIVQEIRQKIKNDTSAEKVDIEGGSKN